MDGRTDGQTDGGDYNIPFAFLKKRGDNNGFQIRKYFIKIHIIIHITILFAKIVRCLHLLVCNEFIRSPILYLHNNPQRTIVYKACFTATMNFL